MDFVIAYRCEGDQGGNNENGDNNMSRLMKGIFRNFGAPYFMTMQLLSLENATGLTSRRELFFRK